MASALAEVTVEDLSDGRGMPGLGVSHERITGGWHGQAQDFSLQWASQHPTVVRQVLDGREAELDGAEVRTHGFSLLLGVRKEIPLVVAALGPKMLELAPRHADGVLLNWTTPGLAEISRAMVLKAAAAAGNPRPAVGAYRRPSTLRWRSSPSSQRTRGGWERRGAGDVNRRE